MTLACLHRRGVGGWWSHTCVLQSDWYCHVALSGRVALDVRPRLGRTQASSGGTSTDWSLVLPSWRRLLRCIAPSSASVLPGRMAFQTETRRAPHYLLFACNTVSPFCCCDRFQSSRWQQVCSRGDAGAPAAPFLCDTWQLTLLKNTNRT